MVPLATMPTANFHAVPVVDVTRENIVEIWPTLQFTLQNSAFVSIDLEMSGIGGRKGLMAKSIDERYNCICEVAKSRAILSMGVSCFSLNPVDTTTDSVRFMVHTYNITLLCEDNYVVEPKSLTFLVEHGFDFNKQYCKGVLYHRGEERKKDAKKHAMQKLFHQLIKNKIPIVFHNALVDLIFLYQHFYTDLPTKLSQFTADLCEMFPNGIFDTKYVTEFLERMPASYLEYVFRKSQKENLERSVSSKRHVLIEFPSYPSSCGYVENQGCSLDDSNIKQKVKLCECFSNHGWCPLGKSCPNSHDVDAILQKEDLTHSKKRRKNRQRRRNVETTTDNDTSDVVECEDDVNIVGSCGNTEANDVTNDSAEMEVDTLNDTLESRDKSATYEDSKPITNVIGIGSVTKSRCEGHRAGFDSFMTGFSLATFISKYGTVNAVKPVRLSDFGVERMINQIYLCGKDYPLPIVKSDFSKPSKAHRELLENLTIEVICENNEDLK